MGVALTVVDFNHLFNTLAEPPIIVNEFDVASEDVKQKLNNLIYARYDGDTLDIIPTCECHRTVGEFNIDVTCRECGTKVSAVTERPLESTLWIAAPKGVRALINPAVWNILSKQMTISGCNVLEWLCNPSYSPRGQIPPAVQKLQRMGVQRGLNFFIDNFDGIMDAVFNANAVKCKGVSRDQLMVFLKKYRHCLFPNYIPIPSKMSFITEETVTGTYATNGMATAADAIRTITSIKTAIIPINQRVAEIRTVKAISQMAEYYNSFYSNSLGKKVGWLRKHVFGSRLHFSFRAVISSLSERHDRREIHMPWSMSVMLFRAHLSAKLQKRGYTPRESNSLLNEHTLQYSPLLDELFCELIAESPFGGIPIILQRNPTLVRLSAQALLITKVKTDVNINTVSMSTLVLKGPNADFDGDALNGMLVLDHVMWERVRRLESHLGIMDQQRPRMLSGIAAFPPPIVSNISNWMYENE